MLGLLAALLALLLQTLDGRAEPAPFADRAGDVYEIRLESATESTGEGSIPSSGRSRTRRTLVERVVALRDGGVELEFDLPAETPPEERAREWEFPARVVKSPERPFQLLNGSEIETRLQSWLERSRFPQAMCGRWFFTWTAMRIECDPQSVLQTLEPFDLRLHGLRDGAMHREAAAAGPAPLRAEPQSSNGAVFVAEMEVDPETVRRERAEADVAVAEITGKEPLTLEVALQARAADRISGTIAIRFEMDSGGRVVRRTRLIQLEIAGADGSLERRTTRETTERRLISRSGALP